MTPDPELEAALRAALRPQPPPRDLAPLVLARWRRPAPRHPAWATALLAAGLVLVVLGVGLGWRRVQVRRQAVARADARQLVQALHLAAARLDQVQRQLTRLSAP